MFNSFTIYGVMRTMNVSEGIIASRRGCWRVQVGWHLDFESGLAGIGSAGPTIAPITKRPGTGRGFKVTPHPSASCRSLSPGWRWPDPSPVRPVWPHLPGTRHGLRMPSCLFSTCIDKQILPCCKPMPLGNQRFFPPPPAKTRFTTWCPTKKRPFVGSVDPFQCPQQPHGVSEASEVKSIHMEGPGALCVSQLSPRQLCSQPPNKAR